MAEQTKNSDGATFNAPVTAGRDVAGRDIVSTNIGASSDQLRVLFEPLHAIIAGVDEGRRGVAQNVLKQLEEQAAKGKSADDGLVSKLLDGFIALIPEGVGAVVSAFASPLLGAIVGPATRSILAKFKTV